MYQLSREDGRNLRVNDTVWEAALAVAFANGWIPAGTRRTGQPAWNAQDYFSRRSQRVVGEDALELASALVRGLLLRVGHDHPAPSGAAEGAGATPVLAPGMTQRQRHLLRGIAVFVRGGGFTID